MTPRDQIADIVNRDGVIACRDHPELRNGITYQRRRGRLTAVLPGVYAASASASDPRVLVAAVAAYSPDAVLTRDTAAHYSYWPQRPVRVVTATCRHRQAARPGLSWERRVVPEELITVRHGLRLTSPSLTALDLSDLDHTEAIDVALRRRVVTPASLREALQLTAYRRGNRARWAVVIDSRSRPWSYSERLGHRLLRGAGITGWLANAPFEIRDGLVYYIDIAFERQRLAVEIDGRVHATDPGVFESDRWRQNALVLAGWRVLRFTYRMVVDHPELFVTEIRRALRMNRSV